MAVSYAAVRQCHYCAILHLEDIENSVSILLLLPKAIFIDIFLIILPIREKDRKELPFCGSLPQVPTTARVPKLGTSNSIQVSHREGRDPTAELSSSLPTRFLVSKKLESGTGARSHYPRILVIQVIDSPASDSF